MRYSVMFGLILLVTLIVLRRREFQIPAHGSDKVYDRLLATLLSRSVPEVARLAGIEKQDPLAVYCSVGYRSERIAEKLPQQRYTNVVNVYGGVFEWVNTGRPVVPAM